MNFPAPEIVCIDTDCCLAEEDVNCGMEDMTCCPPGMCNPAQCAFCCFVCTVNHDKIIIKVFDSATKTYSAAEQFLLPGFTSECFQPPELA